MMGLISWGVHEDPEEEGPGGAEVPRRGPRRRRRRGGGTGRAEGQRLSREVLVRRAAFLPAASAALVRAHLDFGMTVGEIATLERLPVRQVRWRLKRLCARLSDPCFVLAAQYRGSLPGELASLAQAHWLEDRPLRELARSRGQTVYRVRQELTRARSLLLVALSREQAVPAELAEAALEAGRCTGV